MGAVNYSVDEFYYSAVRDTCKISVYIYELACASLLVDRALIAVVVEAAQ